MNRISIWILIVFLIGLLSRDKDDKPSFPSESEPQFFTCISLKVNGEYSGFDYFDLDMIPEIKLSFSQKFTIVELVHELSGNKNRIEKTRVYMVKLHL